jgi:nucleotide-binding universal stress UspA family protein
MRDCPDGRQASRSYVSGNDEEESVNTLDNPILICYDRSEGSRRAIEKIAEFFPGKTAIVLHVWSPLAVIAHAYSGAVALPTYSDDELQQAAVTVAEDGWRWATAVGLHAKPEIAEVTSNGTWHTILDVADEYDASLIVVGARGLSAFKSIMLGSVSHGVAQHSHRPVLVVPPAVATHKPGGAVKRESVSA